MSGGEPALSAAVDLQYGYVTRTPSPKPSAPVLLAGPRADTGPPIESSTQRGGG